MLKILDETEDFVLNLVISMFSPDRSSRFEAWNFIKKETLAHVFPCEFCETFKNIFINRTTPVPAPVLNFSHLRYTQIWTFLVRLFPFRDRLQISIREAPLPRYSYEKMFWKYAANLQENTHAELWYPPQTSNYIRKETLAQVFSCGFWEIFKNTFI